MCKVNYKIDVVKKDGILSILIVDFVFSLLIEINDLKHSLVN